MIKLERTRKGLAIKSDCCPNPFGYIRGRNAIFSTPHNGEPHLLIATEEDLQMLIDEIRRNNLVQDENCDKLPTEEAA